MDRILAFVCALLLTGAVYFRFLLSPGVVTDSAPIYALIAQKLRLPEGKPAEIGLFGDSRSVMASASDIGVPQDRFFNYSVGGQSFRTSVAMIEMLTDSGGAPRIALVNLDHLEIGMMGPPGALPLWTTLRLAFDDLRAASAIGSDALRAAWRQAYTSWEGAKRLFGAAWAPPLFARLFAEPHAAYRKDGSHIVTETSKSAGVIDFHPATRDEFIDSLLIRDLTRLKNVTQRPGGPQRLIVYESPLAPPLARRYAENPTSLAANHRQLVRETCARLALECVLSLKTPKDEQTWPDATHPPARVLGSTLRALIDGRAETFGPQP